MIQKEIPEMTIADCVRRYQTNLETLEKLPNGKGIFRVGWAEAVIREQQGLTSTLTTEAFNHVYDLAILLYLPGPNETVTPSYIEMLLGRAIPKAVEAA